MIEHVSLRVPDSKKARRFYAKALEPLGYTQDKRYGDSFGFAQAGRHDFWVTQGKLGTPLHLAFHADGEQQVRAFYEAAMRAGGKDNGAPGPREDYGYAAFVLDPDGNNIEAVVWPDELKKKRRRPRRAH
jgi:catechol 2,3-dioxygenase-like lactoylglutathione lyase family enzyme